jgi:group I intron endonuclease
LRIRSPAPNNLPHITDLEILFMSYFPFEQLYNFAPTATSMQGYKHNEDTKAKMKARLLKPENHPMFRKTHTAEARKLISKPGQLNPMFGKIHTLNTKLLISNRKGQAVSLYN